MEPFKVHILGCGSALPTLRHNPSSQVVEAAAVGSTLPVVTNPNCFAPHDYDMPFYTLPGSDEFEKPRMMFTPCLLGPDAIFIKDRMSPLPPAVEAMNISRYPELFYTNY